MIKKYDVRITYIVDKTFKVRAENIPGAYKKARSLAQESDFGVWRGGYERYCYHTNITYPPRKVDPKKKKVTVQFLDGEVRTEVVSI
jgi:hypothetical protein